MKVRPEGDISLTIASCASGSRAPDSSALRTALRHARGRTVAGHRDRSQTRGTPGLVLSCSALFQPGSPVGHHEDRGTLRRDLNKDALSIVRHGIVAREWFDRTRQGGLEKTFGRVSFKSRIRPNGRCHERPIQADIEQLGPVSAPFRIHPPEFDTRHLAPVTGNAWTYISNVPVSFEAYAIHFPSGETRP